MTLIILDSTRSTMDAAREMLRAGEVLIDARGRAEPAGVVTLEQTSGRGQRGRTWHSERGESLCATYFVPVDSQNSIQAAQVAIVAGVAVVRALEAIIRESAVAPNSDAFRAVRGTLGLKWPNDIVLSGRKLGGILVETVACDPLVCCVGVGVNTGIREFPNELAGRSTSLAIEGVLPPPLVEVAEMIAVSLSQVSDLWREDGFGSVVSLWRVYDASSGRTYHLRDQGDTRSGVADGIDPSGALILRMKDGTTRRVLSASTLQEA